MTPGAYNNNFQMFQTPEYVVILNEMVHDARIVPLDGRPHGHIRQWKGDSRGHWEGNTLVVDTTNFKRETSLPNSSANTHLVERFTRTDANTLLYEFTVDDPTMWTRPWTAVVPMRKSDGSDLRIRLSRGELRHGQHPRRSARRREGRGRSREEGIEVSRRKRGLALNLSLPIGLPGRVSTICGGEAVNPISWTCV